MSPSDVVVFTLPSVALVVVVESGPSSDTVETLPSTFVFVVDSVPSEDVVATGVLAASGVGVASASAACASQLPHSAGLQRIRPRFVLRNRQAPPWYVFQASPFAVQLTSSLISWPPQARFCSVVHLGCFVVCTEESTSMILVAVEEEGL